MAKACMLCDNEIAKELDLEQLYSDEDGNVGEENVYICKEGKRSLK